MNHEEKPTSRLRLALTTIVAMAATAVIALPASALQIGTAPPAVFELDGNAFTDHGGGILTGAPDDWDRVCYQVEFQRQKANGATDAAAAAAATALCTATQATTGATAVAWAQQGPSTGFTFTGGGSKDPLNIEGWAWNQASGGLPGKDILLNGFAARYNSNGDATTCPGSSNGSGIAPNTSTAAPCNEVFFGMDRFDNSGDAQNGFWFLQNALSTTGTKSGGGTSFTCSATPCHKNGDVLVVSDFSIGGTISTITVYQWDTNCTKAGVVVPEGTCADTNLAQIGTLATALCPGFANAAFCGIVNSPGPTPPSTGNQNSPWPFMDKAGNINTFAPGEFYEGGIDLSHFPGLANECFASSLAESRSSTSTSAVLKSFVLQTFGKCTSTTVTTPKYSINGTDYFTVPALGVTIPTTASGNTLTVKDQAVVTVGTATSFGGNVTFYLCGPLALNSTTNCNNTGGTSTGVQIGATKNVIPPSPVTVLSDAASLTEVARYCWRGVYSGDSAAGVPGSSDPINSATAGTSTDTSTTECFVVNPVTPVLTTSASGGGNIPATISDTATLSGTANHQGNNGIGLDGSINATAGPAGGTISFSAFGPNGCSTPVTISPTSETVSGDNTYGPVSGTVSAVGTYIFVASYGGDSPNTNASPTVSCASEPTGEQVTATDTTSITTTQNWLPNDSGTITSTGGTPLGGTAVFTLYDSANCTGTVLYSSDPTPGFNPADDIQVSGGTSINVNTSNTTIFITVANLRTVSWKLVYTSNVTGVTGSSSSCETTTITIAN